MNRFFVFLITVVASVSLAQAGDVKLKLIMTTGPDDEAVTSFAPDAPKLYAMFKTKGVREGDKIRGVLIAEDVGDAAPADTKVLEKTLTLDTDTQDGDFNFSKPDKGWPVGKYRVDIYVNGDIATSAKFTIKGGGKSKKSEEDESEGSKKSKDEDSED